jgi:uncharacterized protein YjbI with pentapeptide repeats
MIETTATPESQMSCSYRNPQDRGCQFGTSATVSKFGGECFCVWHLPSAAKQTWSQPQKDAFHSMLLFRLGDLEDRDAPANFTGVVFASDVDLTSRRLKQADFRGAVFIGAADFELATFSGDADLESATFGGPAYFRSASFEGAAKFKSAVFCEWADFCSAVFRGPADFEAITVAKLVAGRATEESVNAEFDSAIFSGDVDFTSATFSGYANFKSATFAQSVSFERAIFCGDAKFATSHDQPKATLKKCTWKHAEFHEHAEFDNRVFAGEGNFGDTIFAFAPTFHGSRLHQAMIFPDEDHFRDIRSLDAAYAYRTLKLGMAAMKSRADEGKFFTLEQRCWRNVACAAYADRWRALRDDVIGWLTRSEKVKRTEARAPMSLTEIALSWLYDVVSDFGRNASRPILGVVLIISLFSVIYAEISAPVPVNQIIPTPDGNTFKNAAAFSLEQVLRPLYVWGSNSGTLYVGEHEKIPLMVKLIASIQSIVSVGLISLSLLALNWRFKRD